MKGKHLKQIENKFEVKFHFRTPVHDEAGLFWSQV